MICTLFFLAVSVISFPATTRDSLFASTTSLPALSAARVGSKPMAPTTETTTTSASSKLAKNSSEFSPVCKFVQLGILKLYLDG